MSTTPLCRRKPLVSATEGAGTVFTPSLWQLVLYPQCDHKP